ncbi:putative ubiquitin-activating enzyme E1 [Gregarina niphandrodes]|uniref:NEDD8-activating enzyme E1 catalytic subunit n=1 Tax=Gregarina niphandrodes TaxID=110365 RepID=A0A023B1C6_GRENI|nr:putative ubiquitin-activating enzyme E1 [Gregarina niphandrodes]EZG47085.1 putative ubiquitin-activating enzyme E1 [Gregarina niphandrodes]|eukprot:XP_011132211.1 putative ubiquitin-activating enzyme E1 [Gregarina niphandrodes]
MTEDRMTEDSRTAEDSRTVEDGSNGEDVPLELLRTAHILVAGVGGIGNYVAKALLGSGFCQVDLIDMDIADNSNLNRQILFRQEDVGRPKAEVARERLGHAYPDALITAHHCRLQDKPLNFYSQFDCILSGLDNVESRRWLNSVIYRLYKNENINIPLIDGGTDSLMGHCRVILPLTDTSACFECTVNNFLDDPDAKVPLCSIAQKPRSNKHCVHFAALIQWPEEFPSNELDLDNDDHLDWLNDNTLLLCQKYNFPPLTKSEQKDVLKRTVPAIASTNQLIGHLVVSKAIAILTGAIKTSYYHYNYDGSLYPCLTGLQLYRNPNCTICQ